jgi:Uma2 family endonuclease
MAAIAHSAASSPLTYEQYLAEGETLQRYDIIDGTRVPMTNPTELHQDLLLTIAALLKDYGRTSGRGKAIIAPCDVLVRRAPLRTRQPDVLFISNERRAQNRPPNDPAPLSPAPELVVEILSPSDTESVLQDKITDYCAVDVRECWVVDLTLRTVGVRSLTQQGALPTATYGVGSRVQSIIFPDLTLAVDAIFAE